MKRMQVMRIKWSHLGRYSLICGFALFSSLVLFVANFILQTFVDMPSIFYPISNIVLLLCIFSLNLFLIAAILAIIFGIISLKRKEKKRWMAVTGIGFSSAYLIIMGITIFILLFLVLIAYS